MNSLRLAACAGLALLALTLSSCATNSGGSSSGGTGINDTARYLAGLPGGARSELAVSRSSAQWKGHASRMDGLWSTHRARRGHLRGFRSSLGGLGGGTVFYPFGGPDYLHASALFPGANTYILVGLEGVDPLPDLSTLSASELSRGLNGIANSLKTVTGASYFITKDMRVDLNSTRFRGALPLIMAMAAREGQSVRSVRSVGLDSGGRVVSLHHALGSVHAGEQPEQRRQGDDPFHVVLPGPDKMGTDLPRRTSRATSSLPGTFQLRIGDRT